MKDKRFQLLHSAGRNDKKEFIRRYPFQIVNLSTLQKMSDVIIVFVVNLELFCDWLLHRELRISDPWLARKTRKSGIVAEITRLLRDFAIHKFTHAKYHWRSQWKLLGVIALAQNRAEQ